MYSHFVIMVIILIGLNIVQGYLKNMTLIIRVNVIIYIRTIGICLKSIYMYYWIGQKTFM